MQTSFPAADFYRFGSNKHIPRHKHADAVQQKRHVH